MSPTWLVRADSGGRLASEFNAKGLVAIGWVEAANTLSLMTREAFVLRMKEAYPEDSKPKQVNAAGQVFRFMREMQVGDQVVTYDNARRIYLVGKIHGEAQYDSVLFDGEFPNFRRVEWLKEVSRDALTLKARNSLGSTLTLFKVPTETVGEIEALMRGAQLRPQNEEEEPLEEENLLKELQSKSHKFIKDRVSKLAWEQSNKMMNYICLLQLGGEGGGLKLVLEMTQNCIFSFAIHKNSDKWLLLEDEDESDISDYDQVQSTIYNSEVRIAPLIIDWQGALRLLDDTGWTWPLLSPIFVHPCISGLVLGALKNRYQRYPEICFESWDRCVKESNYKVNL